MRNALKEADKTQAKAKSNDVDKYAKVKEKFNTNIKPREFVVGDKVYVMYNKFLNRTYVRNVRSLRAKNL